MSKHRRHYHVAQQVAARRRHSMTVIMAQWRKNDVLKAEDKYDAEIATNQTFDDLQNMLTEEFDALVMSAIDEAMQESQEHDALGRLQGSAKITLKAKANLRVHRTTIVKRESPPKSAEYLLHLFLSREDREAMLGCLEEDYQTNLVPKYGVRKAQFVYWCEVGRNIPPVISGVAGKLLFWFFQKFSS